MHITCPACSARYRMDPQNIDPDKGRIVKCSSCGHRWRVFREVLNPEPEIQNQDLIQQDRSAKFVASESSFSRTPEPNASDDFDDSTSLASPQKKQSDKKEPQKNDKHTEYDRGHSKKKKPLVSWIIALLIFITLLIVPAFLFRRDVVKMLPQTERVYELFGIEVKIAGISLVMPFLEKINKADGSKSILIQGSFINSHSTDTLPIPPLKITLLNSANLPISTFTKTDFDPKILPPGGVSDFTYEIDDINPNATDIRIKLEDAED